MANNEEKSTDKEESVDLYDMPPLESDEEKKESDQNTSTL